MLMMITTVGTLHTGSEGKITFRFLHKSTIRIDAIVYWTLEITVLKVSFIRFLGEVTARQFCFSIY